MVSGSGVFKKAPKSAAWKKESYMISCGPEQLQQIDQFPVSGLGMSKELQQDLSALPWPANEMAKRPMQKSFVKNASEELP